MSADSARGRRDLVRFGEFEVDLVQHLVSHRGVRINLQRQPLRVLELLIARAPEIVTRDEIRHHVWGDDVYVDADQNINFCIRQIRAAFGDGSEGGLIQTLPRQGYRFVAPFNDVAEITLIPQRPLEQRLRSKSSTRWRLAALGGLLAVGATAGVWAWIHRRSPLAVVRIIPVTTYEGDEREPSLSPDGRQIAFSWGGERGGNRDVYVAIIGEQHPVRVTFDPDDDVHPEWSPDGRQLAFLRRRSGTLADIMLVPALGGPETKLREVRLSAWISGRMLAWTPDGKQLCFTSEVGPSGHHTLFLLTIASGAVKQLLPEEENALGDSSASFSPDGKWLAFARFEGANNSDLLLQRLGRDLKVEGRPIVVKEAGVSPRDPVWTPDGKRVLFLDRSRIMETTVGQPAHTLYLSDSPFTGLAASAGSARLVACRQNGREQMWTLPLTANGMKVASSPEPLAQSTAGESSPRFSPDGRWLAFFSRRTGATEVWLANSDGSNPRQLTHASFYAAGYVRWSADSRYLAFQGRLPRTPQLYIVGIEDGTVRQITFSPRGFMGPSWSLDGRFLYADALQAGNNRTYSVPIAGGVPRLLFEGDDAVEVPGRKLLIYGKQDRPGIYGRALTEDIAKSPEQLLVSDFRQPWGGFQPVPEGIYYVNGGSEGGPRAIRFYTFDTKISVNIFSSLAEPGLGLTVMPDRSRLAYTTRPRGGEDLVELELH